MNVNIIIYDVIEKIAEKFIEKNEKKICRILGVTNLNRYRAENEMYQVFTNYLDSHVWFYDEKIQKIYENSKYRI